MKNILKIAGCFCIFVTSIFANSDDVFEKRINANTEKTIRAIDENLEGFVGFADEILGEIADESMPKQRRTMERLNNFITNLYNDYKTINDKDEFLNAINNRFGELNFYKFEGKKGAEAKNKISEKVMSFFDMKQYRGDKQEFLVKNMFVHDVQNGINAAKKLSDDVDLPKDVFNKAILYLSKGSNESKKFGAKMMIKLAKQGNQDAIDWLADASSSSWYRSSLKKHSDEYLFGIICGHLEIGEDDYEVD